MDVRFLCEGRWLKMPSWATDKYSRTYLVSGLPIPDDPASDEYRQAREMALMAVRRRLMDDFAAGDEDAAQWRLTEAKPFYDKLIEAKPFYDKWSVCAAKKGE